MKSELRAFSSNQVVLATTEQDASIDLVTIANVPEPASLAIMGAGLLRLLGIHRRKAS